MCKNILSFLLLLLIPVMLNGQDMDQKSKESKYKTIYKSIVSALDNGQVDKLDEYIASDVIDHDIDPSMTTKTGLAAVKEMVNYYNKVFPDMKNTIHSIATSGNLLFAYITFSGTTSEPYMGMPANTKITIDSVDMIRFEGDKVVEHWGFTSNTDVMKMMSQDKMMDEDMDQM